MQKVKAISGANTEEFAKLDKSAQKLGRSTFFTAQQVASLQLNFSKLGFTASEVLKVQEAALTAATATGEDLARTATVIGSTIRGFGLDASEGARVADVMAASFTSSALTLEKFQTSMTKVSPVAKLLGMDLEETTAVMGVLTDAGIEASIAGTSLRNIFLKLGDPSSDLAKSIGFTVNSGEDMVREFRRMRDEGINVEKMLQVVDVRQVAAIATMIEHIDKIESQTKAFRLSAGAAQDMAETIGDSLQGAVLRFQSALDGLRIVFVEKIAPAMQKTLDILSQLFNKIASANEVSMSEMLEQDRLKMNALVIETSKLTEGSDERKKAIEKLQRLYPNYFSDLDAEKAKNDALKKSLGFANEQYLKRIALRQKEDKLNDIIARAEEERNNRERLSNQFTAEATKLNTKYNLGVELIGKTSSEAFSDIKKAMEDAGLISKAGQISTFEMKDVGTTTAYQALLSIQRASTGARNAQTEFKKLQEESQEILKDAEKFAKEFGLTMGMDDAPTVTTTGTTTSTPTGDEDDPAKTALGQAQLTLQKWLLATKTSFANKEIETKQELNNRLYDIQIVHLEDMLEIENLSAEQRIGIEEKIANLRAKKREDDIKATEDAEKAKSELIKANIENAMGIGKSLTEIGKLMGENSAAAKAGIAVTRAASVAKAIEGIINAKTAIADQAASGDPYSAFARMALMASAVAPLIASLMALKGDGGSGVSDSERYGQQGGQFEQGGLTRGGMFVGNSHANGGVKFRVGGRIHEAEGGEAIINKRSTSMFRPVLSAINSYNGNGVKFADGGLLNSGEKFAMGGELRSAQQLLGGGFGTSKVVIVESDMTDVQNRISAIESQATF